MPNQQLAYQHNKSKKENYFPVNNKNGCLLFWYNHSLASEKAVLTFDSPKCVNFSNDKLSDSVPMYDLVAATVANDIPSPRKIIIFFATVFLAGLTIFSFLIEFFR